MSYPTNVHDVIDSRDVIDAIADLSADSAERDAAESEVLTALVALAAQGADYAPDWEHGETLVRDSYFVEYAQELAYECDMLPADLAWPLTCIDWADAARELQFDYCAVDFDGVTYWVRS